MFFFLRFLASKMGLFSSFPLHIWAERLSTSNQNVLLSKRRKAKSFCFFFSILEAKMANEANDSVLRIPTSFLAFHR
jgi:hypothetical protein